MKEYIDQLESTGNYRVIKRLKDETFYKIAHSKKVKRIINKPGNLFTAMNTQLKDQV